MALKDRRLLGLLGQLLHPFMPEEPSPLPEAGLKATSSRSEAYSFDASLMQT